MFYTTEASLNEKDLHFSKHGGVHEAFGEHYVKTGLFDARYHRWLLDTFDRRIEGDYSEEVVVVDQDANELIEQAKDFLQEAKRFLSDG
jgi:uncharacterized protein (UPF0332 family)